MKRCSSCFQFFRLYAILAFLALAGSAAVAQITITESDLQNMLMNSTRMNRGMTFNPPPIVDLGSPSGTSQTFNFSGLSGLESQDSATQTFIDPAGQVGAAEFPASNLCTATTITDPLFSVTIVLYFKLQADGLYQLGAAMRQQIPLLGQDTTTYQKSSPPQIVIPLPLTYGTTRAGHDTLVSDPVNNDYEVSQTSMVCDGWGDITYPAGASPESAPRITLTNCLRTTSTVMRETYVGGVFDSYEKEVEVIYLSLDGTILSVFQPDTLYNGGDAEVQSLSYSYPVTPSTDVRQGSPALPEGFALSQNYPNPFNPSTMIAFSIPAAGHVSLTVYDVLGREVATLVDRQMAPGSYEAVFDAAGLPSGLYIYRIVSGSFAETRKMNVVK
jgi:hypothetical protein